MTIPKRFRVRSQFYSFIGSWARSSQSNRGAPLTCSCRLPDVFLWRWRDRILAYRYVLAYLLITTMTTPYSVRVLTSRYRDFPGLLVGVSRTKINRQPADRLAANWQNVRLEAPSIGQLPGQSEAATTDTRSAQVLWRPRAGTARVPRPLSGHGLHCRFIRFILFYSVFYSASSPLFESPLGNRDSERVDGASQPASERE